MATAKSPLTIIPGVGPSIAADLEQLGYTRVSDLAGQDPEAMYARLMDQAGRHIDRCVLYVFRCAVYFVETAHPAPAKLLWWNWKD